MFYNIFTISQCLHCTCNVNLYCRHIKVGNFCIHLQNLYNIYHYFFVNVYNMSSNLLYHSLCFTLCSTNKNLTHVYLFNQMLIFCLFIFQTFSFLKVQNKNPTLTTATITGPPPISPAPLKRDHQHCHWPSTTAARSTPQPASQLPK